MTCHFGSSSVQAATADLACTIKIRLIENAQAANNINQRMPAVLIRSRAVEFIPLPRDGT